MKILLTFCFALLTCATLHAQSVIVQGTGAGEAAGAVVITTDTVSTNLSVTGTLAPDVTGTYSYVGYDTVEDSTDPTNIIYYYYSYWSNTNSYYVRYVGPLPQPSYYISTNWDVTAGPSWWNNSLIPTGTYSVYGNNTTGTATVAYWHQTNYSSSVTLRGTATP